MRDPRGSLHPAGERVARHLHEPLPADDFLHSALASRWTGDGRLVPFEIAEPRRIVSPRLPFVTYPEEWCDLQLHDAGALTLQLQGEATADGFDMKDASAWNILFDGARPVFCDHLSFSTLISKPWWAAGQFSRHFLLPLLLAKQRGLHAGQAFRVWRDGVPPEVARSMLGLSRFLGHYWPLMDGGAGSDAAVAERDSAVRAAPGREVDVTALKTYRNSLNVSLTWMLKGLRPGGSGDSAWARYESERTHYDDAAMAAKKQIVDEWLARLAPRWVADLGCNAGEFSLMARQRGAQVVSIDSDHDAIQGLYRRMAGTAGIFPMITPLDDLLGGRGWAGDEFAGAVTRLANRFDLVMALALIHHLMVGAAIPVAEVAKLLHGFSRQWAIVEFIDCDDVQLRRLCAQRQRDPSDFGIATQRAAFVQAGFAMEAEVPLPGTHRTLALMRKS